VHVRFGGGRLEKCHKVTRWPPTLQHAQGVPNPESMQRQLDGIVRQAIDYYGDIPASLRNFDQAKAEFLRSHW
jgi:hypothetical protein